jgi:putative peptidoglycan lipid II flippase
VALPTAAFVVVFAPEIVWLVFYRGAFTETAVALTSQALRGIAFGLWASTLGWILLRTLNCTGRNARAAFILVTAYAANMIVNLTTAGIQEATGLGPLIIGLGETARSLVLLIGTVFALDCRRRLFFLIMVALGPAALMLLLGWQIHQEVAGALHRMLAGGLLCLLCIALEVAVLMPAACQAGIRLICSRISITRTT